MIANYHTHTVRCYHATGKDEEYVVAAIRQGLKVLGFSDHTPQFYKGNYTNPAKMLPCHMEEYVSSILALKNKYKEDIEILLGFETEYFPLLWDELLDTYRQYPIDYLILGQHMVGNESTDDFFNAFEKTSDHMRLRRFFDQEIEAIETGRFTYIAHPDVINFTGEDDLYCEECTRLILRAKELCIPLEINLLGLTFGRHYPNPLFWKTVGKLGAAAIIGCDAHSPDRVANVKELKAARAFADKYGVKICDTISLQNPIF